MREKDRPLQILLLEDNPIDVLMTRGALKTWEIENNLHVVEDGHEAVDFLYRRGIYYEAEQPDSIVLDLNLPRKSGIEVLSEIKRDSDISNITVVVVTTSAAVADLPMSDDVGAKRCIAKPLKFEEYVRELCSIQEFWFSSLA